MGSGALRLLSSRFQDGMIFKSNFIYTPKAIVVLESLDEAISGFNGVTAILSQCGMTAVVQKNHGSANAAALDSLTCVIENALRRCPPVPVVTGDAPHHRLKLEFASNFQHRRATRSERGTKVTRLDSGCIGNRLRTVRELMSQF